MILVTGGCRSGKSAFAEQLVTSRGNHFLYLATAKITDSEMAQRVEKHRQRRSSQWDTHEGYGDLTEVLENCRRPVKPAQNLIQNTKSGTTQWSYDGILLDSVTTMVTNLLFDSIGDVDWDSFAFETVDYASVTASILAEFEALCQAAGPLPLCFVTDEIGLGVVPETCLGRNFRDILGSVNQYLASVCTDVYFVVSGIPMHIKDGKANKGEALFL